MKLWSIILCCVTYYFHRTTAITFNHHGLSITYEDYVLKNITGTPDTLNVDLSRLDLTKIDDYVLDALKNIESLDLSDNLLRHLPQMAVEFGNLKMLSLADNTNFRIDVRGSTFRPFNNLEVLNLANTGIKQIRGQIFARIPKTANIIIEGNAISEIQGPIIDDMELNAPSTKPQIRKSRQLPSARGRHTAYGKICLNVDGILEAVEIIGGNGSLGECKATQKTFLIRAQVLGLLHSNVRGFKQGWCGNCSFSIFQADFNRLSHISSVFTDSLPLDIITITLSHNIISTIEDGVFERFKSLHGLKLGNNRLKNLDFVKTLSRSMLILYVENNRIDRLDSDIFQNLTLLTWLDLSHNVIRDIPRYSFNRGQFRDLNLQHNNIEIIRNDTFPRQVDSLHLNSNKIYSIEPGSFKNMTMASLYLNDNKITEDIFSNNVFEGASTNIIDLNSNSITKIPRGVFKKNLKISGELRLASNPLEIIKKGVCEGLHDLYKLDLTNTKVRDLKNAAFFGLSSKCKINTNGVPLRLIQTGVFHDI